MGWTEFAMGQSRRFGSLCRTSAMTSKLTVIAYVTGDVGQQTVLWRYRDSGPRNQAVSRPHEGVISYCDERSGYVCTDMRASSRPVHEGTLHEASSKWGGMR